MATADQQKIAIRKLNQWIENDRRIVTYRDISREVGCHVNIAKNLLLSHYSNNPTGFSPMYMLTGPLLSTSRLLQTQLHSLTQVHSSSTQRVRIVDMDEMSEGDRNSEDEDDAAEVGLEEVGNDKGDEGGLLGDLPNIGKGKGDDEDEIIKNEEVGRWGVVLVGEDGLEEKKKLFEQDTLSIHIHSLAPSPITDPAQYLIPNLTLRQHANYRNPEIYGTISGESLKPSVPLTGDKKTMKDGGMDWSGSKKVTAGLKKDEVKKKEESKKEEVKKVDNKQQSPFTANNAEAAPITKRTASNTKPSSSDAKPTSSASGSLSGKKKRIIQSDTEEDEPTPSGKSKIKSGKPEEPTSSMVRADDQKAMEAMMSMDMDMDMDIGLSDEESKDVQGKGKAEVQVKKEPGTETKIRKKRRVKKSRTVEDKKGRMVTKDYSTDESYTASETEEANVLSKPKGKPIQTPSKPPIKARESTSSIGSNNDRDRKTPASSGSFPPKKSSGGGAKGQSTLKGFFTKK